MAPATRSRAESGDQAVQARRCALDAVSLLTVEVWLLVLIPDKLVVGPLGGIGSPALVLGVGLLLLWGITCLTPSLGLARTCVPLRIVLATMWVSMLISYALMNFHAVPSDELLNSDRFLISMTAFTGVALTAAEGLRDRKEVLRILRTIVAGVSLMSVIGILQFRPGFDATKYLSKIPFLTPRGNLTDIQSRGGFLRPSSTAVHPIEFGVIVGCTLAFALHFALYDVARPKWRRWLPVGLMGFAIPVSISRSALLAAAIVLFFFFAGTTTPLRRRGAIAVIGFVLIVFMTVPGMIGTLKGYVVAGNSDNSISHRSDDYGYAAPFLRRSPWLGRGTGSYLANKFRVLDNQYLDSLIEVGLVGTTCLVGVYLAPVLLGRGMRRRSTTESDRNLGQMLAGAAAAVVVVAQACDVFSFPTLTALIALILGIAGACWCQSRHDATQTSSHADSIASAR